ncbi:MAG: glycosyltransferase family 1 protein, partial [Bacteroidetes bacterium]|nr:glycosyltransferase family 1 protein [Bacteroidota bacterium]
ADNITPLVVSPQARHPILFYIWFNITLASLLNSLKPDLFLSPDGYGSLPFKGKSLLVIHDLNFEHYPADLPWLVRWYYRYFFPRFAKNANRIATVSEFSKKDISTRYGIREDLIDVVYNGVNELYTSESEENTLTPIASVADGNPYFIFIGSLHPRKNLVTLFKAFDIFKNQDTANTKLVIAGEKKWWTSQIKWAYASMFFRKDVIFTGRCTVRELKHALSESIALVYVSYFEGFGIPILEAFACKTAVITSNVTSMPEIAGDAALLVDPFDKHAVAEAMQTVASSADIRKELIIKGLARVKEFSWQRSADLLWNSILKTIQQHND